MTTQRFKQLNKNKTDQLLELRDKCRKELRELILEKQKAEQHEKNKLIGEIIFLESQISDFK